MPLLQCSIPGINYLDKCQNSSKNSLLTSSITKIMKLLVILDKSLKLLKGCFFGGHYRSFNQNLWKLGGNFNLHNFHFRNGYILKMHNFCPTWQMQLKLPSTNYSLFLDNLRPKYGRCTWEIAIGAVKNLLKGATWNTPVLKNSIFTPFLFIHHLKLLFIKIEPVKRLRMHSTFATRNSIHTLIA